MITQNAVDRGTAAVALDIMLFFTNQANETQMALANKTIPANTAALNDPQVQVLATVQGFGNALNLGIPMANTPYADAQWGPVGDATNAIWNGSQTVEQALASAQAAIESAIANMGSLTMPQSLSEADCPRPEVLCIGLVTDVGELMDHSFNQSAWEGVQQAQAELGALVNYIQTTDTNDYAVNIAYFADRGYDVIVTVGFALGPVTTEVSQRYPDTYFIGIDQYQSVTLPNLVGLIFHEDQAGFLAGALAAMMSRTGTVAGVYGTNDVPPVVAFHDGFQNGALYINPNITVISTYHPGGFDVAFADPAWGASTAAQAIQNGADVIFGAGGQTGNGALIETVSHPGLYCIGVDTDQWETLPDARPCLISSAMKLIDPDLFGLIQAYWQGNPRAGNYYGQVGLAPFHDFENLIPQSVKDRLTEIAAALDNGSLSTGYNP
jgi:basic membrane protein A